MTSIYPLPYCNTQHKNIYALTVEYILPPIYYPPPLPTYKTLCTNYTPAYLLPVNDLFPPL